MMATDDSLAILNEYKDKLSFRLINQSNAGLSAARNHGIRETKGKYIILMDSDDYIYPDYIEYLYNLIQKFLLLHVHMKVLLIQVIQPLSKILKSIF